MAGVVTPYASGVAIAQGYYVRRRPASAPVAACGCALIGFLLALTPRKEFLELPRELAVWSAFGALLVLAILGYRMARMNGMNPWVAPVSLLGIYYFFRYGWGSVVIQYWEDYPWQALPHLRMRFHHFAVWENLVGGIHVVLVFGFGLAAGGILATLRTRSAMPSFTWPYSEARLKRMAWLYLPVGCFINSFLQFGLPLTIRFTIALFGSFMYPMIMLGSYWLFSARSPNERSRWALFVLVSVLGSIPVGLVTGQVNGMLMPGVMAALGYVVAKGRPPWKLVMVAIPVLLLVVLPFATLYKLNHGRGTNPSIGGRLETSLTKFTQVGHSARLEMALERSVLRFAGANMPTLYARYYPQVYPFELGRSFMFEASSLVPRILWPQKPYAAYELNRYAAKIGIVQYEGNTTALFDAPSEYYLNFGLLGTFALAIVHGYYWQALYKWLTQKIHPLIGSVMILALFSQNEDFYAVLLSFTSQVKTVPIWLILFYLLSRKTRPHVAWQ